MSDDLILGIDGGGSKVLVALADRAGTVLRMSRSGGVNPMDNPNWRRELDLALGPFLEERQLVAVAAALPAYGEVARLSEQQREAIDSQRAADRKSQVGSGDRSERIRTYNFPQGRVTDHRINLTLYNLPKVMEGEALDDIIDPLIAEDQAARLAALEEELA